MATTQKPKYGIANIQTGEFIEVEMTAEEIAERKENKDLADAKEAAKAAARQSALAKLAELGLTEEEIAAL